MARKTKLVTIEAEGRDKGKVFLLTEMPARQAEKWATRALMALARSGVDVSDDLAGAGAAGLITLGVRAITTLDFDEAEPLLDEMMGCIRIIPDPARPEVIRDIIDDDFEDVSTILFMRSEVVELHVGFSIVAALSTLGSTATDDMSLKPTETSPEASGA